MSTIAAISTPNAVGGISVIRISGENALEVAKKVFCPVTVKDICEMAGYTCCYGKVIYNGEEIDDAILTVFKAPRSYTGEDTVEISCHGGIYITNKVLRAVISSGAIPAQSGEFTKRAFLNGKLSLTQAEAVMDLISSQGEQFHKCAVAIREGALFKRIKSISDSLLTVLGELGAWVDYPEEDIPAVEEENLKTTLISAKNELEEVLKTYDSGRILKEGIDTAIVGRPNVGKSTLMNLLSGFDRSIVTDIAGTTRDIVEESVRLGEIVLRLSDTAGIRETDDVVENVGVSLAIKKLNDAMLVLAVFDNSQEITKSDLELIESLKGKNVVAIINKTDTENKLDVEVIKNNFNFVVMASAKNGTGKDELLNAVEEIFKTREIDSASGIIANERQKKSAELALASVRESLDALIMGETLDAVTVIIDEAVTHLLDLTGERTSDAVVNEVFSKFCVGK